MKYIPLFINLVFHLILFQGLFAFGVNAADDPIKVQLKWTHQFQFAGFYAAIEKGFYEDADLKVELLEPKGEVGTYLKLFKNEINFAVMDSNVVLLVDRRLPLVVTSVFFQESPLVLAVRSDRVKELENLAGKKLAIEEYSSSVLAMLAKNGINVRNSNISNHSLSPQDFIDGKIDAMTIYTSTEPFRFNQENVPFTLYDPKDSGINFYGDTLVTSMNYWRDNPKQVEAFTKATLKGWEYALKNKDEIIDLILAKNNNKISREFLLFEANVLIPLLKPTKGPIGQSSGERWQKIIDVFVSTGFLDKSFDMTPYLYDKEKYQGRQPWYLFLGLFIIISFMVFIVWKKIKSFS